MFPSNNVRTGGERVPRTDAITTGLRDECAHDPLCNFTPCCATRRQVHETPEALSSNRTDPTMQRPPSRNCRGADDAIRAQPLANLARRKAIVRPKKQAQTDGATRVPATVQHAARTHRHHGAAGEAPISTQSDRDDLGLTVSTDWPNKRPFDRPVPMDPKALSEDLAGHIAPSTTRYAHLTDVRHPIAPGLAFDRRMNDS